jgi:protein-S-isoprenylcysteine O-methyltransferase Ste14
VSGLLFILSRVQIVSSGACCFALYGGVFGPLEELNLRTPFGIIELAWVVFALYWLFASFARKETQTSEPYSRRIVHIAFMAMAFYLVYRDTLPIPILRTRIWPDRLWIAQLGAALTALGIAFAIWARNHIGRNWSGRVTIKRDHELIRTGPYAHIRHPIYTGLLLAALGTGIALGEYRAFPVVLVIAVGFAYKAKSEEKLLAEHFGPAFEEHKRHTGFFLPRFN